MSITSYTKTRIMVECALMIALGTILANIKIYELPNGGSITLFSMVPFILVSFRHGVEVGPVHRLCEQPAADAAGLLCAPGARPAAFGGHDPAGLCAGLLPFWGLPASFAKPFKNKPGRRGRGLRRRVRAAFPVQLFVRRADLGQPERWSARVDRTA